MSSVTGSEWERADFQPVRACPQSMATRVNMGIGCFAFLKLNPCLRNDIIAGVCNTLDSLAVAMPKKIDQLVTEVERHQKVVCQYSEEHVKRFWAKGICDVGDVVGDVYENVDALFPQFDLDHKQLFSAGGFLDQLGAEIRHLQELFLHGLEGSWFDPRRLFGSRGLEAKLRSEIWWSQSRKIAYDAMEVVFSIVPLGISTPKKFCVASWAFTAYSSYWHLPASWEQLGPFTRELITTISRHRPEYWKWIMNFGVLCSFVAPCLINWWIIGSAGAWADVPQNVKEHEDGAVQVLKLCHEIKNRLAYAQRMIQNIRLDYKRATTDNMEHIKGVKGLIKYVQNLNMEEFLDFLLVYSLGHVAQQFRACHVDGHAFVYVLTPDDFKDRIGVTEHLDVQRLVELHTRAKKGLYHRPGMSKAIACLQNTFNQLVKEVSDLKHEWQAQCAPFYAGVDLH